MLTLTISTDMHGSTQMRATFNAQERTLRELAALTQSAGWKIVDVVHDDGSLFGHLTAVPVEIPEETLALSSSNSTVTDVKTGASHLLSDLDTIQTIS